jgi:YbgC/YbaW family acyl-CoA thioester hydrolase
MSTPAFEIQRHVEFYETDMAGIVHFSNFFRFMETCEHAFVRSLDFEVHGLLDGLETGWPRVNASCDYRAPARFGDLLTIRLFIAEVRTRSVRYLIKIILSASTPK